MKLLLGRARDHRVITGRASEASYCLCPTAKQEETAACLAAWSARGEKQTGVGLLFAPLDDGESLLSNLLVARFP